MPFYDYACDSCGNITEIRHEMSDQPTINCPQCASIMHKQISATFTVKFGNFRSLEEKKDAERMKKIKDPDRAVRNRKKLFGASEVGTPSMKTDPKHVIKRGRTLGGQQIDVDKKEVIKALAKDNVAVAQAQKALNSRKKS